MEMTQQEYRDELAKVANLASGYAKTGNGYSEMKTAFNALCEKAGANKGITPDATIGRRKLIGQSICIKCISALSKAQVDSLGETFNGLAEDIAHLNLNRRPARRR